jgi:hypothetical protein
LIFIFRNENIGEFEKQKKYKYSDLICRYKFMQLCRLLSRQTLSTTITWFRALSLTSVYHGRSPPEVFRGSNWQPADTIRTDDDTDPIGVPDDWDKYNRVVYPPTAPGETPRKGVMILDFQDRMI